MVAGALIAGDAIKLAKQVLGGRNKRYGGCSSMVDATIALVDKTSAMASSMVDETNAIYEAQARAMVHGYISPAGETDEFDDGDTPSRDDSSSHHLRDNPRRRSERVRKGDDGGNPRDDLAIVTSGTIPDVGVRKCRREVLWWRMDEASAMANEASALCGRSKCYGRRSYCYDG